MLEIMRSKIMGRINTRRLTMSKKSRSLCVKIKIILDKNIDESVGMTYIWNGMNDFEVKGSEDQYTVDTGKCHCSCGTWQLSGVPCAHAIVCLRFLGKTIVDCVPKCYKKSTFLQTYTHVLNPMCGRTEKLRKLPTVDGVGKLVTIKEVAQVESSKKKASEPVEAEPAEQPVRKKQATRRGGSSRAAAKRGRGGFKAPRPADDDNIQIIKEVQDPNVDPTVFQRDSRRAKRAIVRMADRKANKNRDN
ncbi:hypothetical protein LIER_33379 [Lithospermum erythrorhizon]|uniref:SWIM-type domain-containing protein n=1 Tax=Lithospermum erythrorhizon TaxID=34254 RepID=A0AAV3S1S5_LITER